MTYLKHSTALMLMTAVFAGMAVAPGNTAWAQAASQNTLQNNAYVSLSGTVGTITDKDEFMLNYGGGQIKVDTNDAWPNLFKRDANQASRALNEGDRVTVVGKIDDNWFTEKELDAYSLHHESGGQVFNYEPSKRWTDAPVIGSTRMNEGEVNVTGTITQVLNNSRYQMRYGSAGTNTIEIDTTGITGGKNQRFTVGDRVTVTGKLDDTFFGKREINVDTIQKVDQLTD